MSVQGEAPRFSTIDAQRPNSSISIVNSRNTLINSEPVYFSMLPALLSRQRKDLCDLGKIVQVADSENAHAEVRLSVNLNVIDQTQTAQG